MSKLDSLRRTLCFYIDRRNASDSVTDSEEREALRLKRMARVIVSRIVPDITNSTIMRPIIL